APRHRRHRLRLAAIRHQYELGLRLGRAPARPAGRGSLREKRGGALMTELLFYQLRQPPLQQVLPALLEKSPERGWRGGLQVAQEEPLEAPGAHLGTYRGESFLPHGTDREREAAAQPILLTLGEDNPNGADVRFLVDGAAMPTEVAAYRRIVLLFDGEDAEALAAARERWTTAKASGFDVTYWQMDDRGRWQRQA